MVITKKDQLSPDNKCAELPLQNGSTSTDAKQNVGLETPIKQNEHHKHKRSILWVMYMTMHFTMISIAIEISSSWPYLQRIRPKVSPNFLGWANVGFNIGAILGDLIFGKWMTFRPYREPILASLIIMISSGLLYAYAQGMGEYYGPIAIFISRVLLGFTRGNMTCTRGVVSEFTTAAERSAAMANLVIAMTSGFAVGSATQAAMVQIGENGVYISALKMHLNLYTIPAYLIVVLAIANISIILRFMKPITTQMQEVAVNQEEEIKSSITNRMSCICLIFLFSVVNYDLSTMETIMTPFIQHQFALTRAKAVLYSGLVFTSQGLIGIFQMFFVKHLSKRFRDKTLLAFVFSFVTLSFLMYIPMGNTPLKITESFYTNKTSNISVVRDTFVGCPVEYAWCKSSSQIWIPKYFFGVVLFAIGYSACLGLTISLFSKQIGGRNKGTSMGIISAFGNVGRLTAPIIGAESYVNTGPKYTFLWMMLLGVVGIGCFLALFKYMVPIKTTINLENEDSHNRLMSEDQNEYNQHSAMYVTTV